MKRMNMLAPILGELGTAQTIFLIGLALLIVILLVRSRRYFRQVTQYQVPRPDASPALRQPPRSAMPPRDFEQWEVTMHDLARDLSGQLDSKIRVLELLIREADKTAARLETALARTRSSAKPARETVRPAPAPPNGKKNGLPSSTSAPAAAPRTNAGRAPLNAADKPRFDRIYALADAGLSPATIANQIGSQVGEVELILGIRGEARGTRGEGTQNNEERSGT
jgi:hypothetical protein